MWVQKFPQAKFIPQSLALISNNICHIDTICLLVTELIFCCLGQGDLRKIIFRYKKGKKKKRNAKTSSITYKRKGVKGVLEPACSSLGELMVHLFPILSSKALCQKLEISHNEHNYTTEICKGNKSGVPLPSKSLLLNLFQHTTGSSFYF